MEKRCILHQIQEETNRSLYFHLAFKQTPVAMNDRVWDLSQAKLAEQGSKLQQDLKQFS